MATITNLVNSIKTRVQAVLGSSYSELGFTINASANNFTGNSKRYGVLAGPIEQDDVAGVLGHVTYNQQFIIKLTDSYVQSSIEDDGQITVGNDLMEKIQNIYKDLVNTKAGLANTVITVQELDVPELEYYDKTNTIMSVMSFTIKYRVQL